MEKRKVLFLLDSIRLCQVKNVKILDAEVGENFRNNSIFSLLADNFGRFGDFGLKFWDKFDALRLINYAYSTVVKCVL